MASIPCPHCNSYVCVCPPLFSLGEPTVSTDKKTAEPTTPKKRGLSPELQAIAKIDRILADFTPEDAARIMRYIQEKTYSRLNSVERPQDADCSNHPSGRI